MCSAVKLCSSPFPQMRAPAVRTAGNACSRCSVNLTATGSIAQSAITDATWMRGDTSGGDGFSGVDLALHIVDQLWATDRPGRRGLPRVPRY
jgi:hypothetical protein